MAFEIVGTPDQEAALTKVQARLRRVDERVRVLADQAENYNAAFSQMQEFLTTELVSIATRSMDTDIDARDERLRLEGEYRLASRLASTPQEIERELEDLARMRRRLLQEQVKVEAQLS